MKTLFELWRHYLNYEDINWVMKTLFELLVDDIHWYTVVVWLNSYHGNKLTKRAVLLWYRCYCIYHTSILKGDIIETKIT
jgi:hypothetical protein